MRAQLEALVTAHLAAIARAFARAARRADLPQPTDGLDADELFDYFGYFYEPFQHDREFTFTREYNAQVVQQVFKPRRASSRGSARSSTCRATSCS